MSSRTVSFDLDNPEVAPLLINALSHYADVLDEQSEEQRELRQDYADYLGSLALQARSIVERVHQVAKRG